jgi:acetyltransferase-like isoleucine patch superfamily enzyme
MMLSTIKRAILTWASPIWVRYIRARGIFVSEGVTIIGRPGINRKRGSEIYLGRGVTLCSSGMANPVADCSARCRLATLAKEAQLNLHDGVGLSSTLICCAIRVEIGEGTQIGGGAMIFDTDFHPRGKDGMWLTDPVAVAKPVVIGRRCFIGARAIILKGVTIGDGSVVGAGSVVTKPVPAGVIVAGNPATVVKILPAITNSNPDNQKQP